MRNAISFVLCLVAASCGSSEKVPTTPTATSPARSPTAVMQDYWRDFTSGALPELGGLFAETATSELVDWGLPLMRGPQAIVAGTAGRWKSAFPEMDGSVRILLDDGAHSAVALVEISGTQRANFAAPGRTVAAEESGKGADVRLLILHTIELDEAGLIAREQFNIDVASYYQQKGISGGGGREREPRQVVPEVRVVATNSPAEKVVAETVARFYAAGNDNDVVTFGGLLDDRFIGSNQFGYGMYLPALDFDKSYAVAAVEHPSGVKVEVERILVAGDWAVVFGRVRGPGVDLRTADVLRLEGGKVLRNFAFLDGLRLSIQTGQFADFAAEEAARLAAPPVPEVVGLQRPPDPTPAECDARYASALALAQGNDLEAAVSGLTGTLGNDVSKCRALASKVLAGPAFDGIRKTPRFAKLASEAAIDPKRNLVVQACEDPQRLAALIDPKLGVGYSDEWEATPDEGSTDGIKQGFHKGQAALNAVVATFGGDLWCFAKDNPEVDYTKVGLLDNLGSLEVTEPVLADVKDSTVCFGRDEQVEWTTEGEVCLVNTAGGWRIAFISNYPSGPVDKEAYAARAQKQKVRAFKRFGH